MKTTDNYGLKKPESTDFYNVEDQNENMEIIDSALKEIKESVSDVLHVVSFDSATGTLTTKTDDYTG